MGGRAVAAALDEAGLGAGDRATFAGNSAIAWTQTFIGCLRAGVALVSGGVVPTTVDDELVVRRLRLGNETPPVDAETRLIFGQLLLSERALVRLASDASAILGRDHVIIGARGAWHDWRYFAGELLGGLVRRAEIHVVHDGVTSTQLAAAGSLPEVAFEDARERPRADALQKSAALRARVIFCEPHRVPTDLPADALPVFATLGPPRLRRPLRCSAPVAQ